MCSLNAVAELQFQGSLKDTVIEFSVDIPKLNIIHGSRDTIPKNSLFEKSFRQKNRS